MHLLEWMKQRGPIRKPISNERLAEIAEAGRTRFWVCSNPGVGWSELELMATELISRRRMYDWMPCGHQLRHWSPLEGTAAGAILFEREPEKHGFCEVCRAVEKERKRQHESSVADR